ncbi:MAG TPA: hypothetical protein VHG08_13200 [Longimicrobium sp.]|nr:hypothetical protein [Longimicrobium sp.]
MSAAVPRRPARWPNVVRAEARALVDLRYSAAGLMFVLMLGVGGVGNLIGDLSVLMFFYPLVHWRGRAVRGSLDEPVPFGATAHDLVRVACGAADAALVLAAVTAIHLGLFAFEAGQRGVEAQVAPGYGATVAAHGIAAYLLGSAVVLCARRPARALPAAFVLGLLAMLQADVLLGTTSLHTRWSDGRVVRVALETRLSLSDALFRLALAAGAVGVAAWLGRNVPAIAGPRLTFARLFAGKARRAPLHAAALAVSRRPAALETVAVRQFAVQAGRMSVPLGLAALFAAWCFWRETLGSGTFLSDGGWLMPIVFGAFFWPVLVWQDERASRDWDELHPVDTVTRRLLHAVGGLVWLQAAVLMVVAACIAGAMAEGTLQSLAQVPAWTLPGLPLGVLGLYFLGTAWAMLSRHPIRTALIGFLVTSQLLVLIGILLSGGDLSLLSPSWDFTSVHLQDPPLLETVLWTGIYAALAVAAIYFRARRELHGRFARRPATQ